MKLRFTILQRMKIPIEMRIVASSNGALASFQKRVCECESIFWREFGTRTKRMMSFTAYVFELGHSFYLIKYVLFVSGILRVFFQNWLQNYGKWERLCEIDDAI